jgi:hypothetical protein
MNIIKYFKLFIFLFKIDYNNYLIYKGMANFKQNHLKFKVELHFKC